MILGQVTYRHDSSVYGARGRNTFWPTGYAVVERPSHVAAAMHVLSATRWLLLAGALGVTACDPAPSRSEALEALKASAPGIDTTTVFVRVWQDGPPWFSCAEVIAKFTTSHDAGLVRDQVGNWKPLVLAGWLVLRDTSSGVVSDPGWCAGKLSDAPARGAGGWIPIVGDSFPTRSLRRGWRVPVGVRRLAVVGSPRAAHRDSATVEYVATVAPNANGMAVGADRDSTFAIAELRRRDGRWHVITTRFRTAAAAAKGPRSR